MRKAMNLLIVLLFLTAPLATAVGTVGPAHNAMKVETGPRGVAPPTGSVDVTVQNTLNIPRKNEVIRLSVPLGNDELRDIANFKVVTNTSPQKEVLSGALLSTLQYYPNGSIKRMDVAFQDDFGANEVKHYKIVIGQPSGLPTNSMSVNAVGATVFVSDGKKSYIVNGDQIGSSCASVRSSNSSGDAVGCFLTYLGGNQFTPDQVQFQIFWGSATKVETDASRVMATVHLKYDKPNIDLWSLFGEAQNNVPIVSADVVLNFYHGRDMVDVKVTKSLNERIYNHNGFVQEFTSLAAGDDTYQIMFGNSHHTTMTARTKAFTTALNATIFSAINAGNRTAPAFADWTGDGLLDMAVGNVNGTLIGYTNTGNKSVPKWTKDLSAFTGIDVGSDSVPEFADVDGDGKMDLLIGRDDGGLSYYHNTGTLAAPIWTANATAFAGISAGTFSAPALDDINANGKLELILGNKAGDILCYNNTGSKWAPTWVQDALTFKTINTGATRKNGTFSSPDFYDIDNDSLPDLISGVEKGKFGASVFFYNTGTKTTPKCDFLFPGAFNNVRGGDYTHPVWADLTGDGLSDLVVGRADGKLDYYINQNNSTPQRAGANMQPLENGTYRFWYDQDRNDGQYVTIDQAPDFKDYYVISSKKANRAVMRFMPEFDNIVYKDRYYGNAYPSAGGNVSYYPFLPKEDGYITRGGVTFGASSGGATGATFISQTGTAAGFVQMPIAAQVFKTHDVILDGLKPGQAGSYYDDYATVLGMPLVVSSPADLKVDNSTIAIEPNKGEGQTVALSGTVENLGGSAATSVDFEFHYSSALKATDKLCAGKVTVPGFSGASASCQWATTGFGGTQNIFLIVDPKNATKDLDKFNNLGNNTVYVPLMTWTLSPTYQVSNGVGNNNSVSADLTVDSTGKPWAAWSTYEGKENWDVGVSSFDGTTWATAQMISKGNHWSLDPALAPDATGKVWLTYSSNKQEYVEYLKNESGRNYWNTKFDAYVAKYDGAIWGAPTLAANAFKSNDTDQAPDMAFVNNGSVWMTYRTTRFQLYAPQQIVNDPFTDMRILAKVYDTTGGKWGSNVTIDDSFGAMGWWRGPQVSSSNGLTWFVWDKEKGNTWTIMSRKANAAGLTAIVSVPLPTGGDGQRPAIAALPDGTAWAVYESHIGGTTEVFASHNDGSTWSQPTQLTFGASSNMKPVIAVDSLGNPWVAYESMRNGNKEIYMRHFNGVFWSSEIRITQDPSSDQEPTIATGPNGAVWVGWESDRNGLGHLQIFARKVTTGSVIPQITGISGSPLPAWEDQNITFTSTVTGGTTIAKGWDLDGKGTFDVFENLGTDAWTTGNTIVRSYPQKGTVHVRFIAVNENDLAVVSEVLDVTVNNKPPVSVAGKPQFVLADVPVTFNGSGSYDTPSDMALGLQYKWDFGDKNVTVWSAKPIAIHYYTAYGFYNATLTVRDNDLATSINNTTITVVHTPPIINITIGNLTGFEDQELTFLGHGNDTVSYDKSLTWKWVFGDGSSSDYSRNVAVKHAYKQKGLYKAMFIVNNKDNMSANKSISVNISNVPPAVSEITGPTDPVPEDTAIIFTGTGEDNASDMALGLKYHWDFGDGSSTGWINSTEVSHNYTKKGPHRVVFIVMDNDLATANRTLDISVTDVAPAADIDASVPTRVDEDTPIAFKGGGTDTVSDVKSLNYSWDFGDGTNAAGTSANHTYTKATTYTVTFTATDNENASGTDTVQVTVVNVVPTVKIGADKTTIKVKETVAFNSAGTTDTKSNIATLKYLWTFGDGASSTLPNPTHTYTTVGTMLVTLKVTDAEGASKSQTLNIVVNPAKGGDGGGGGPNMGLVAAAIAAVVIVVLLILFLLFRKKGETAKPKPKVKKAKADEEEEEEAEEEEVEEKPKKKVTKAAVKEEEEGELPEEKIPKKPVKGAAVAAVKEDEEE